MSNKEIKCPECGELDSIEFEGRVSLPVYVAPADGYHYWDWDSAEIQEEGGYVCNQCNTYDLQPDDFVVEVDKAHG